MIYFEEEEEEEGNAMQEGVSTPPPRLVGAAFCYLHARYYVGGKGMLRSERGRQRQRHRERQTDIQRKTILSRFASFIFEFVRIPSQPPDAALRGRALRLLALGSSLALPSLFAVTFTAETAS